MLELTFYDFHEQNYNDEGYCLYVMKNGTGGVLYVGISTNNVWDRWFGWGGHVTWDGNILYGESSVGTKIENHLPDSLSWIIQLWTLNDCLIFCGKEPINPKSKMTIDIGELIRDIEPLMIRKLSPSLNRTYNLEPGKDTTPKSDRELKWERYVDKAYDEIFNKKKR